MQGERDMAKSETATSVTFPKRPILHGIASLFDFHGSQDRELIETIRAKYRNPAPIPSTEDAIRATWQSVGDSMRWAIREYERELDEKERE
jgi:hypothetical protein